MTSMPEGRTFTIGKQEAPAHRCPHCGNEPAYTMITRGAITISPHPITVSWRSRPVPLSPTEAAIVRMIAIRGRATWSAIDQMIEACGTSVSNRPVLIWRIRKKFVAAGAKDPFERLGSGGVRLKDI